jgi:ubiquinone/menaquinone biosynthesis C-methylase UbiE
MTKLNLGSHNKKIDGFLNVDALSLENVDIVHNLTEYPYPFDSNSVDEILLVEVLEHISFRETHNVLKEIYRILKVGGNLTIQVPDIREMMFCYWNEQICDCVERKPKTNEEGYAKLNCPKCKGYGRVHPERWLMAFCGAQKHEYDNHLNIFTPERLEKNIRKAGFEKVYIGSDVRKWKIIATVIK